jgi:hypothetical protein
MNITRQAGGRRRTAALAAVAAVALSALVVSSSRPARAADTGSTASGATAVASAQQPLPAAPPTAGMPAGVPPAATAAEPTLPAPPAADWPFGESWSRTEGTGRLGDGASFWTDYVYDDHGAGFDGLPIGADSLISDLAPTQGVDSYPAGPADKNGADIFRTAVGVTSAATYWRVDWNTLVDATVPAAEWVWDDGTGTTLTPWPRNAGVESTGVADALFVSSQHAFLMQGGVTTDLSADVTVDMAARSFIVRIPRSVLPVSGTTRLRMGSGLASADGTQFAAPVKPVASSALTTALSGASLPIPGQADNLMNVTFRTAAQEPPVYDGTTVSDSLLAVLKTVLTTSVANQVGADGLTRFVQGNFWDEDDQADALQSGDVSAFSLPVTWSALEAKDATPDPLVHGYSNRWYVTPLDLGQGAVANSTASPTDATGDLLPNYLGRVQPYAVYVPTTYTGSTAAPLTWVLHSLAVNLNQYGDYDPTLLQELCQDRGSICATTEGFGPDLWYFNDAETDYWDVWHALATTYRLDPTRTVVGGYSMGGWAAYKLGLEHPDLYAQAYALEGPPTCGAEVTTQTRLPAGSGQCSDDGLSLPILPNARWLPYSLTIGAADELVPVTSNVEQAQGFDSLDYRYHAFVYPGEDHLVYATQDRFGPVVATIGHPVVETNPGHVTYIWYPDTTNSALGIGATTAYWLSGLAARSTAPGQLASVDAVSAGRPDPAITVTRPTPGVVTVPTPGTELSLDWTAGASPAARDALSLTLTDVASLRVDAARAGLSCPTITTTSDGLSALTVTDLPSGSRTFAIPAGVSTHATCAGAGGAGGAGGGTGSRADGADGAPGPAGSLAFTGSSPALPATAGGLLAVGAAAAWAARRRRRRGDALR